jgi:hypothetical protein
MGFKEIIMGFAIPSSGLIRTTTDDRNHKAIKKQSAHKVDKARQRLDEHNINVSLTKLPDDMLNEVCSFLHFKDRRSLTETAKQFSPLETGPIQTQSLGITVLQQLATNEAIQWINDQLQLVGQNPIELIKKIANKEVVIPDYLVKQIVSNILANKAIEVARTLPNDSAKSLALSDISKTLSATGNIDQAIDLANTIPIGGIKSATLCDISKTLLEIGNIDQAIDLANTIPYVPYKSIALEDISKTLLENRNIDRAIDLANTIPSDHYKSIALQDISKHVQSNLNIDRAIDVANTIPYVPYKSSALRDICDTLSANGNIDRAIDLANTIPSDHYKSIALQDISKHVQSNLNQPADPCN